MKKLGVSWRRMGVVSVLALVLAPVLASCAEAQSALGAAGAATGGALGGKCPDVAKLESILAFDFAKEFKISAAASAKLKAATLASVELKGFADQVDADLRAGCGGIATDLGAGGQFADGKAACDAAMKALADTKGKLGANAKIALVVKEPRCSADLNAYGDCAAKCDATVDPGKAKVECEPGKLSGRCDAECTGSCELQAAAKCDGQCNGSCDAEIKGSCSGKCNGTCDGKESKGASCAGTCDGKCEGGSVKGECKGKCGGSCETKASAKCDGTCTGKCSAEFKEPKCTGEVQPPKMSADCKAQCDTRIAAHAACTPAKVGVAITGAADPGAEAKLRATLEKNLPLVLKVAVGLGERSVKVAGNAQAVIEGVQGSIAEIAATSGDPTKSAMIAGQITACLGDSFKGALGAAGSLKANVNVSIQVKASATGSVGTK